jgi:hypothetical protein
MVCESPPSKRLGEPRFCISIVGARGLLDFANGRSRAPKSTKIQLRFCSIFVASMRTSLKYASQVVDFPGDPYGTRTRVFAVRGRRPRPLDEGANVPGR